MSHRSAPDHPCHIGVVTLDPGTLRAGLVGRKGTVRHAAATEDGGWEAVTRILRGSARPTACGVGSLNQLFGIMAALRASGVAVPGQMSVVSFDEDECLAFLDVPVTSVAMPLAELGGAAVDQLIARIERQQASGAMIREPMTLVPRRSVPPPQPGALRRARADK